MGKKNPQTSRGQKNFEDLKSYDLKALSYAAIFGGVVPTLVLGTRNAKWFNVDRRLINAFIAAGILILLGESMVFGYVTSGNETYFSQIAIALFRGVPMLLYLAYYLSMKKKFEEFRKSKREFMPVFAKGLFWAVTGIITEFVLISLGSRLI